MKKLLSFIIAVLLASCNPVFAQSTSTHYSLTSPAIGNTTNWGLTTNANWVTIDNYLWNASGGMVVGVNAPSSGTTITLSNPINNVQNVTLTAGSQALVLPPMNATSSPVAGGVIYINNVGSHAFEIFANDGSTIVLNSLGTGQSVAVQVTSNNTMNGTFGVYGPYISSVGTLPLGTSASNANPARSGDVTTGLFSDGAGLTEIASGGTKEVTVGSTGVIFAPNVGIGTATFANPLSVYGGASIGTSYPNAAAPTNGLVVQGNVGIGTSVASAPLTVIGTATISGAVTLAGGGTTTTQAVNTSNASISSTAFANPASSVNANGYVEFPSGVIMEWGSGNISGGNANVTFPIAFPSGCFSFTATPGGVPTVTPGISLGYNSCGTSSVALHSGFSSDSFPFTWMAVGN